MLLLSNRSVSTRAGQAHYIFDSGTASNGSALIKAQPSAVSDAAPNKSIDYGYGAAGRLNTVTDPLGRIVDLTWSNGKLTTIIATGFGGASWTLGYDQTTGKLISIAVQVTNPTTATQRTETVDFGYVAGAGWDAGLMNQVRDAANAANSGDGWDVIYQAPDPNGTVRVSTVTAPSTGGPSSTPTPWRFRYFGPYAGMTAAGACLTDPRQVPSAKPCDAETADDDPYETQTDFSLAGLPIRVTGPHDPSGTFRPVQTVVFDNHMNKVCDRAAAANAQGGLSCTSATNSQGNYTDLDDLGVSTVYTYEADAPYRLKSVKHSAPDVSGYPRLKETETYDGGTTFDGLWAEEYGGALMQGLPDKEVLWTDFDKDWGSGAPPGVPGDGNHWSMRFTGWLDVTDFGNSTKIKFRMWSNDGSSLTVGNKGLTSCFATDQTMANYNCGTNDDVYKVVKNGLVPITIEYSDRTGNAALNLKWDQGTGNWQTIPGSRFKPNLGLITTRTYSRVTAGGTTDLSEEGFTFPSDSDKARHLVQVHRITELQTGTEYKTFTDYNAFGQVTVTIDNYQTSSPNLEATTTTTWFNGTPPWSSSIKVSCATRVVGPTGVGDAVGATTDYECNASGQRTKEIRTVRAVASQPAQVRTSLTTYDTLGRITEVRQQDTGMNTRSTYDEAGRLQQVKQEVSAGSFASTTMAYDHAGHLRSETLPDPDGISGPLTSPVISHEYDWIDSETRRVDARGKAWLRDYDALGRFVKATSPLGAVTTTSYQLGSMVNRTVETDPSGADQATDYDLLGREIARTLESYNPSTFGYDVLGNTTLVTDSAGIQTKHTYNNLSESTSRIDFFNSPADSATTSYARDAAGRVKEVDGPRLPADADDRLQYSYDLSGRLMSTSYPGVPLFGSQTPMSVSMTYDDAGEAVRQTQQLSISPTVTQTKEWTYDKAARLATSIDPRGTTTFTYNLAGWTTQVTDPRPQSVYFGYDMLGRRVCRFTATCNATTAAAETYQYDPSGNLTKAKNPSITYDVTYDTDSRLKTVARNGGAAETTLIYDNAKGQLKQVLDAAGTTAWTYNAANQIQTQDDPFVAGSPVSTYGYDPSTGRLSSRTDAQANMLSTFQYEPTTGRPDTLTIKNRSTQAQLASFDLGYDRAGNVISKSSSVFSNPANGTWSYVYDGAGRMTSSVGPNTVGASTTRTYRYDGAGNRTLAKEQTANTVTMNQSTTYDVTGLPTMASDSTTGETVSYTFDPIGNQLKSDSSIAANDRAFTFDAYSRMTCAQVALTCSPTGNASVRFALDALDRAVSRTNAGTTTNYTWRGLSEHAAKAVAGSTTTLYGLGIDGSAVAEKVGAGAPSFYLSDTHGDVVGMVTSAAANLGTTSFDTWGRPLATTGSSSKLGFQGDITDPVTKQIDMGTRWYDPGAGRFNSRDVLPGSLTSPPSLNQFTYVSGNPATLTDPSGMCAMRDCPPVVGGPNGTVSPLFVSSVWGTPEGQAASISWLVTNYSGRPDYNPVLTRRRVAPVVPLSLRQAIISNIGTRMNEMNLQKLADAGACQDTASCRDWAGDKLLAELGSDLAENFFGYDFTQNYRAETFQVPEEFCLRAGGIIMIGGCIGGGHFKQSFAYGLSFGIRGGFRPTSGESYANANESHLSYTAGALCLALCAQNSQTQVWKDGVWLRRETNRGFGCCGFGLTIFEVSGDDLWA